ncbi:pyridoxal phosphate-dependent aminotransferase [Labilibaculum sp. DW002]|uniref:cysteine-S-conjugate beta-lyase n=1 Tax=Paralabilibaculum antarcticum TaxID=2912572 RepID=A0ABT5VTH0_9BACT|nr:MalY/PatB family protein [Labilibaculum sp. DW002]MDE5418703.1 pyridoxal phosphate-dependent aminotransferase [Labilibaculum sp. DW002]
MRYNFDEIIERKNTDCVKYDKLESYFGAKDLLPLWVADMDFKVPPCISEAIIERANHEIYGYTFRGDSCIKSIQNWLKTRHDWAIPKDWISSSPGVVTGLSILLMSLTNEGDQIAIQSPVYHPFAQVINDTKRKLVVNPLRLTDEGYQMDFEQLEELAKNGLTALVLSNPHNPVGRVFTKEELVQLGNLANTYDFLIISDEIHQDLIYEGYKHIPLASLSDELAQRTITCIAPSKTFNVAGLASSVIIIPNAKLKQKFETLLSSLHLNSGNLFGHTAMQAGYEDGAEWLDQLMDYLKGNVDFLRSYLKENIPTIKLIEPEATYLLWLDCRSLNIDTEKLNKLLIQKAGLALNKGTTFGNDGEGFLRINIGCPRSVLEKALEKIKLIVDEL